MRAALALGLSLLATPLAAQQEPQPALAEGETLETELRGDFNADGHPDLAYIAVGEGIRALRVVTSSVTAARIGENPAQVLALDAYPLGPATLTLKGNVLLADELTGGTTAVFSTHRFRWDAKLRAMRLIGLDATLYSRTLAHDGQEASWNLLNGDLITRTLRLHHETGNRAYDKVAETLQKRRSPPLRLEQSPSGDALLARPGAQ